MTNHYLKSTKTAGYIYLLIGLFFIASNFIVGSYGKAIPPWQLAGFRFLIALCILLPFTISKLKLAWPVLRKNWLILLAYGILGITIPGGFAYLSLHNTTAINGAFIFASAPIFTLILSYFITREKLNKQQCIGIAVTLPGVLIIISHGNLASLLHLKFSIGDLWMLGNAICWALYTVFIKRWKIPLDALTLLTLSILIGVIAMIPFCYDEILHQQVTIVDLKNIMTLLYAGIFAGAIAYLAYFKGVQILGSDEAAIFMYSTPIFATLQAYLFLGEKLYIYDLAAIVLIATGILFTIRKPASKSI